MDYIGTQSGIYYYRYFSAPGGSTNYEITFTSAGAYNGTSSGSSSFDCATSAWSISQLYALGEAFNFIGGSASASTALGDRIVSGTVSAVAEQTSGTVRVSGTLALVNTGNETCDAAHAYSLRINPTTKMVQMCRP
jgi:hypothetical protein